MLKIQKIDNKYYYYIDINLNSFDYYLLNCNLFNLNKVVYDIIVYNLFSKSSQKLHITYAVNYIINLELFSYNNFLIKNNIKINFYNINVSELFFDSYIFFIKKFYIYNIDTVLLKNSSIINLISYYYKNILDSINIKINYKYLYKDLINLLFFIFNIEKSFKFNWSLVKDINNELSYNLIGINEKFNELYLKHFRLFFLIYLKENYTVIGLKTINIVLYNFIKKIDDSDISRNTDDYINWYNENNTNEFYKYYSKSLKSNSLIRNIIIVDGYIINYSQNNSDIETILNIVDYYINNNLIFSNMETYLYSELDYFLNKLFMSFVEIFENFEINFNPDITENLRMFPNKTSSYSDEESKFDLLFFTINPDFIKNLIFYFKPHELNMICLKWEEYSIFKNNIYNNSIRIKQNSRNIYKSILPLEKLSNLLIKPIIIYNNLYYDYSNIIQNNIKKINISDIQKINDNNYVPIREFEWSEQTLFDYINNSEFNLYLKDLNSFYYYSIDNTEIIYSLLIKKNFFDDINLLFDNNEKKRIRDQRSQKFLDDQINNNLNIYESDFEHNYILEDHIKNNIKLKNDKNYEYNIINSNIELLNLFDYLDYFLTNSIEMYNNNNLKKILYLLIKLNSIFLNIKNIIFKLNKDLNYGFLYKIYKIICHENKKLNCIIHTQDEYKNLLNKCIEYYKNTIFNIIKNTSSIFNFINLKYNYNLLKNNKSYLTYTIFLDFRGRIYPNNSDMSWVGNSQLRHFMLIKSNIENINYEFNINNEIKKKINEFINKNLYNISIFLEKNITVKNYLINYFYIMALNISSNLLKIKTDIEYVDFYLDLLSNILIKDEYWFINNYINLEKSQIDKIIRDHSILLKLKKFNENNILTDDIFNLLKNITIIIDSVSNGFTQIIGFFKHENLEEFKKILTNCNYIDKDNKYDYYEIITNSIIVEVKNDKTNILNNYIQSLLNSKFKYINNNMENVVDLKINYINFLSKFLTRKVFKKSIMTIVYNSTYLTWRDSILTAIGNEEYYKKLKLENNINYINMKNKFHNINDFLLFIVDITTFIYKNYKSIDILNIIDKFNEIFQKKIKNVIENKNIILDIYLVNEKSKLSLMYYKNTEKYFIKNNNYFNKSKKQTHGFTIKKEIDYDKIVLAALANIIHFCDSQICTEIILKCNEKYNFPVYTVHDCFIINWDKFIIFKNIYNETYYNYYLNNNIYNCLYIKYIDKSVKNYNEDKVITELINVDCDEIIKNNNWILLKNEITLSKFNLKNI